jgi:hypothetical protein
MWPVCVSLFCRCGRSIVCVVLTWSKKEDGEQVRGFAGHFFPGTNTLTLNSTSSPKGSNGGRDHRMKTAFQLPFVTSQRSISLTNICQSGTVLGTGGPVLGFTAFKTPSGRTLDKEVNC